jgi:hypothetical protein
MKLKHWTTLLALLAMLGLTVGCEEEAEDTETPAAETAPEEAEEAVEEAVEEAEEAAEEVAEETGAEEAAEGGDDSVCGRAAACCEAYVNALSENTPGLSVEQTCASVQNLQNTPGSDTACQSAIDGWRQGLEAAQMEVPGPCQAEGG